MKKMMISLLLVMVLVLGVCSTAYAEEYEGSTAWKVEYDGKKLNANFASGAIQDTIGTMQPGDEVTLEVTLKNASSEETDWYMSNKTLESFEDAAESAAGGAYTYVLTYSGPGGTTELFNSDTVGGDDTTAGVGLHEATNALDKENITDMFFLDTLKQGATAKVTIYVKLDGETQRNAYQETQAELQLEFGVEPRETKKVVKTGDSFHLAPYIIVLGISGLAVLGLAVWRVFTLKHVEREGR